MTPTTNPMNAAIATLRLVFGCVSHAVPVGLLEADISSSGSAEIAVLDIPGQFGFIRLPLFPL